MLLAFIRNCAFSRYNKVDTTLYQKEVTRCRRRLLCLFPLITVVVSLIALLQPVHPALDHSLHVLSLGSELGLQLSVELIIQGMATLGHTAIFIVVVIMNGLSLSLLTFAVPLLKLIDRIPPPRRLDLLVVKISKKIFRLNLTDDQVLRWTALQSMCFLFPVVIFVKTAASLAFDASMLQNPEQHLLISLVTMAPHGALEVLLICHCTALPLAFHRIWRTSFAAGDSKTIILAGSALRSWSLDHYLKVILPLLLLTAAVEAYLTPLVVEYYLGPVLNFGY